MIAARTAVVVLSRDRTRNQEGADVQAGDQEHHSHRREEQPCRAAERAGHRLVQRARELPTVHDGWTRLKREGWTVNAKRIYRLYDLEGRCADEAQEEAGQPCARARGRAHARPMSGGRWTSCARARGTAGGFVR